MKRFEFRTICVGAHHKHVIVEADTFAEAAGKVANGDYLMEGPDEVVFDYDTFELELVYMEDPDGDAYEAAA